MIINAHCFLTRDGREAGLWLSCSAAVASQLVQGLKGELMLQLLNWLYLCIFQLVFLLVCAFLPVQSVLDCKILNKFSLFICVHIYIRLYDAYYQLVKDCKVGTGAQAQYVEDALARASARAA